MSRLTTLAGAVVLATGGPLALTWAAPATATATAAAAQAQAVEIVNFEYVPGQLTVPVGTTVTWTNTADRPHTVTDRGGTFDTDPIAPAAAGTVTFSTPGVYHYFCRINPSKMNGLITVEGDATTNTRRVEALDPAIEGAALSFDPSTLSVPAGSTIVFANVGGKPHTFTADDGSFDTGVVTPGPEGGRFAGTNAIVTVSKPGTIAFHCDVHPAAMKGTLTVTVTGEARAGPTPSSNAPKTAAVDVKDFAFDAAQVSVAPGGKVTWSNKGGAPHTATFDDVALDTGTIDPGKEGSLTAPDKPGSYSYRCNIHPAKMRAVLVVVGAGADPTADAASGGAGAGAAGAGPPPVAVGGGGPGGGLSGLVLATGVIGGFLGGFGIASFLLARKKKSPPPATPAAPPPTPAAPPPPAPAAG
jgi:plastocyanin